jgi:hypothetical protein
MWCREMSSVEIPTIQSVEYDPQLQELTIIGRDGSSTIYAAVPQAIYDELLRASDKQGFLDARVKGHYSEAGMGDQP